MEKSVKNAVFKGFPVLMESDTVGSKQGQTAYLPSLFSTDSQLSSKIKTNFQSNFFRGFYLVAKCMNKRGADPSAIGLPMDQESYSRNKIRPYPPIHFTQLNFSANHAKMIIK